MSYIGQSCKLQLPLWEPLAESPDPGQGGPDGIYRIYRQGRAFGPPPLPWCVDIAETDNDMIQSLAIDSSTKPFMPYCRLRPSRAVFAVSYGEMSD